ncbi:sodium/glutamate symporter [Fluviibacterium sp. DFM31]|uniref:Sodium/glutamate symporter n=1 Tax=Meridianimarinicoccus marinus TaxID=3231483 RepID=A0ABV3L4D4_9RHOB
MESTPLVIPDFVATTLGLLVFLVGVQVTRKIRVLRDFNIPEPVSGGLVAAAITWGIFLLMDRSVEFDLGSRNYFLVVFFAGIGLNARLSDLKTGGKPLAILLGLTIVFIVVQNIVGIGAALAFGMPAQLGVLMGSAALIGGHGTAIAWAPMVAEQSGFAGAAELGIAVATIGLVLAALIGGPIAKYLIERGQLTPDRPEHTHTVGLPFDKVDEARVTHVDLMRVLFVLHVTIILGYLLSQAIAATGLNLPLFVPCLLMGIVVGNLLGLTRIGPRVSRTPALALMSEFSLGIFLSMSLMSLQLWTLAGMGALMAVTMGLQTLVTVLFVLLAVFPLMGSGYRGAVLSAGFAGFGLGATPTAIANMNAVTKRYGPSPIAFVILPLVSAFFVDLANAAVIQTLLSF